MTLKFENYKQGFRIVSLALDECVKEDFMKDALSFVYVDDNEIRLMPEDIVLSTKAADLDKIKECNNFDVLELWNDGVLVRKYNDDSNDNYFFITGGCNSNCIMCPSPEQARKNVSASNISDLMELARHIPSDAPHLTITGGEPFLIGEDIFPFIQFLKEKFTKTDFLFLTNGRIFAVDRYVQMFRDSAPCNSIVAIPVHGSCERVHDAITRTEGSFRQTKRGIKHLLVNRIPVEIRLVVNKMNIDDFDNIADLILEQFKGISYVSIMAMEMTGNARVNRDKIWIPYREAFARIAGAVCKLVKGGIDVKLYNFPICTVEPSYWTLCEKSISPNKVRFAEVCEGCRFKNACGGVFAGTFQMEKDDLRVIV